MSQNTRIQKIKLFIKISIIVGILITFVVLGLFVRPVTTFENAHMKKWLVLNDVQRIKTVERVVKTEEYQDLLIRCVDKIANLPNSNEMLISDAVAICYGGIQQNAQNAQSDEE